MLKILVPALLFSHFALALHSDPTVTIIDKGSINSFELKDTNLFLKTLWSGFVFQGGKFINYDQANPKLVECMANSVGIYPEEGAYIGSYQMKRTDYSGLSTSHWELNMSIGDEDMKPEYFTVVCRSSQAFTLDDARKALSSVAHF